MFHQFLHSLDYASQYIFENLMYVKKNINNFTKIDDVHNINTKNRLEFVIIFWDNVYAFTIGSQKTSENFLNHD